MTLTARNIIIFQRTRKSLFRFLAVAITLVTGNSNAAIFNVTNTNDSAAGSLRNAVNNANNSPGIDTILFSSITGQTITLTSGEITINDDLIISGPITGNASSIIIDGNHSSRVFNIPDANVTLENLTLTKGLVVDGNGGAVYHHSEYRTLGLNDTLVTRNTVTGNFASGGGLYSRGVVTLECSTLFDNTADFRGGGFVAGGANIIQSTISGNTAGESGGGFYTFSGGGTINQSTITGNSASRAGGVLFYDSSGLSPFFITLTIENSIIAGNSGTESNIDFNPSRGFLFVSNSIFGDPASDITGNTGNVFTDDPDLGLLRLNGGSVPTHLPNPGSPAIDAGDNTLAPDTVDQRGTGFSRIVNGLVDIGAVERQPASPIPVFTLPGFIALMTGLTVLVGWRQSR